MGKLERCQEVVEYTEYNTSDGRLAVAQHMATGCETESSRNRTRTRNHFAMTVTVSSPPVVMQRGRSPPLLEQKSRLASTATGKALCQIGCTVLKESGVSAGGVTDNTTCCSNSMD